MSKLDQLKSRPPTMIITSRMDGRYLASLILFWHKQQESPRSISELARLSLETFVEILIQNNQIEFVQTHEAAQEILNRTGMAIKKVIPKNLATNLINEGVEVNISTPQIDSLHKSQIKSKPISPSHPTLSAALTALEKATQQDISDQVKDANSRTEEFKKHLLNPNLNPNLNPKEEPNDT